MESLTDEHSKAIEELRELIKGLENYLSNNSNNNNDQNSNEDNFLKLL